MATDNFGHPLPEQAGPARRQGLGGKIQNRGLFPGVCTLHYTRWRWEAITDVRGQPRKRTHTRTQSLQPCVFQEACPIIMSGFERFEETFGGKIQQLKSWSTAEVCWQHSAPTHCSWPIVSIGLDSSCINSGAEMSRHNGANMLRQKPHYQKINQQITRLCPEYLLSAPRLSSSYGAPEAADEARRVLFSFVFICFFTGLWPQWLTSQVSVRTSDVLLVSPETQQLLTLGTVVVQMWCKYWLDFFSVFNSHTRTRRRSPRHKGKVLHSGRVSGT